MSAVDYSKHSIKALPKLQKAMVISEFGEPSVFNYKTDMAMPHLENEEVLVKIAYAGINPVDVKTRQGQGWAADKISNNDFTMDGDDAVLGVDLAGEVVASKSEQYKVGDKVAALSFDGGGYAQYKNIHQNVLAKIPASVDLQSAGALPCVATTAKQLIDTASIDEGEHVVLSAPAGGVGHIAVQILLDQMQSKDFKLTVICSPDKFNKLEQLIDTSKIAGWIDYTKDEDYPKLDADVLLDLVGLDAGIQSLRVLHDNARAFVVPSNSVDLVKQAASNTNIEVKGFIAEPNGEDLSQVLEMLAAKKIKLVINQTFALKETATAHDILQSTGLFGKLVLQIPED